MARGWIILRFIERTLLLQILLRQERSIHNVGCGVALA